MSKKMNVIRSVTQGAAVLLAALLMIELLLQAFTRIPSDSTLISAIGFHTEYRLVRGYEAELWWKDRFLGEIERIGSDVLPMNQAEYEPHPILGWLPKGNVRIEDRLGQRYTTNSARARSLEPYVPDPRRYRVLIVGDSFTYGSWADDSEVWPTILQNMNNRLQVFNFAVGGYGIDQMLLMLREWILFYKPHLVICAFIDENLGRSLLEFRDFKKPRLKIKDNQLILTNTPIGDFQTVRVEVEREVQRMLDSPFRVLARSIRLIGLVANSTRSRLHF